VIYLSYFHSIMFYGIIFWRNSSNSNNTLRLQKRVVRTFTNIRSRNSCTEQFRKLQILPLQSQYILSLLQSVINSSDIFEHNCEIHTNNTRDKTKLHLPHCRLTTVQPGAYYSSINDLPSNIKRLSHDKRNCETTLNNFLLTHSFNSLEEYFNTNIN